MGILRILLAVFVVIEHCPLAARLKLLPGGVAVEIFFMISGFYMAMVLDGKYRTRTVGGLIDFYASRFFRLWPVFIVSTAAAAWLYAVTYAYLGRIPTGSVPFGSWLDAPAVAAIGLSNLLMVGQDVLSLFHVSPTNVVVSMGQTALPLQDGSVWLGYARLLQPAWSIGTEVWFYLLAPFLLRLRTPSLGALCAFLLSARFVLEYRFGLNPYFIFPLQLPLFLVGALAYRVGPRHRAFAGVPLAAVVITTVGICFAGLDHGYKWGLYALSAAGMAALFEASRFSRWDRTLGEQSYAIYLTHMVVLGMAGLIAKRGGVSVTGENVAGGRDPGVVPSLSLRRPAGEQVAAAVFGGLWR